MTVKKKEKKRKKEKKKEKKTYIGDMASVIAIASGVVVRITYITSVIVVARIVLDSLYLKQLAFK